MALAQNLYDIIITQNRTPTMCTTQQTAQNRKTQNMY